MIKPEIKIKFSFEEKKYAFNQVDFLNKCTPYFSKYGIVVVKENHNVLICQHKKLCNLNKPTILIERADSSIVFNQEIRKLAEQKEILAIVKTAITEPLSLNNCGFNRYHFKVLNESLNLQQRLNTSETMSEQSLCKIKCLIPYCVQNSFSDMVKLTIDYKKARNIDVASMFTIWNDPFIKNHRGMIIDHVKKFTNSRTDFVHNKKEYIKTLLNSKICISPWGWGEVCFRDFEAIYCGCVLLKPNSDHVKCFPNIFDKYCVYFEPDCSDLEDKINYIINNWDDYINKRKEARDFLLSFWDYEFLASIWAKEIRKLYENYHLCK
jgi:hypothetical protein